MLERKTFAPGAGDESYKPVRIEVFIEEQHVPPEEEFDETDRSGAWHIVYFKDGVPVATGRYTDEGGGNFLLGRIAVRKSMRGTGLGRQLVEAMIEGAKEQGARCLHISAQVQAIGFYEKLGFSVCAGVHDECGIPHRKMKRALDI